MWEEQRQPEMSKSREDPASPPPLPATVHGYRQQTWTPGSETEASVTHGTADSTSSMLQQFCPRVPQATWSSPKGCYMYVSQLRNLSLGTPDHIQWLPANLPNLCPGRKQYPCYPGQESNLPSALRTRLSQGCLLYEHTGNYSKE